jgi:ATP-dependent RNA circularization protein (DNA/RNA ligase family)
LYKKDNSSYWKVSVKYDIESVLKSLIGKNKWIAIQGECIAPNVQKNKYNVKEPDLYVFNLITPEGRLGSVDAKQICNNHGLKFVPIINEHYILPDTVNEVLQYAHGQSQLYNTIREGIVFRSKDGKQSFKAVDPLFLLKYDE